MSNSTSYKERKEEFVSGLTGGPVTEINHVTAVQPVSSLFRVACALLAFVVVKTNQVSFFILFAGSCPVMVSATVSTLFL
jgi:hypothetical protein